MKTKINKKAFKTPTQLLKEASELKDLKGVVLCLVKAKEYKFAYSGLDELEILGLIEALKKNL